MQTEKQLNLKQKLAFIAVLCFLCSLPMLWVVKERAKAEAEYQKAQAAAQIARDNAAREKAKKVKPAKGKAKKRKKGKKVPTEIAVGTTEQVDPTEINTSCAALIGANYAMPPGGPMLSSGFNEHWWLTGPSGPRHKGMPGDPPWNVAEGGIVSVPADAPLGLYTINHAVEGGCTPNAPYEANPGAQVEAYTIEVVENTSSDDSLTVTLDPTTFCPNDEIAVLATYPITGPVTNLFALADTEFTTSLATVPLTPGEGVGDLFAYTFIAPVLAIGEYIARFTTAAAIFLPHDEVALTRSSECPGDPPPETFSVTLDPTTGCPGDTITATGSHNITGATYLDTPLTLSPATGLAVFFTIPASIVAPGSYPIVFTTDAATESATDIASFTVSTECFEEPPGPCTPPTPVACIDSLTTLKLSPVTSVNFPGCTTVLKLQTKTGVGAWADAQTGIVPDTEYSVPITVNSGMKARFVSEDGTAGPEMDLDLCECPIVVLPPEETEIPETPAAPTLSKNCGNTSIAVTSPAFVTSGSAQTASIEIRRRPLPDGGWQTVHTFDASGTWEDSSVEAATAYEYAARACNAAGCSAWSGAAAISLISTTVLGFDSPAIGAIWKGVKRIIATGISSLENPLMQWNGATLGMPSYIGGQWVLEWPTQFSAQGGGVLRFQGIGADGCTAFVEQSLVLDNSLPNQTSYADIICREHVAPEGKRIKSSLFRFQAEPLPGATWRRTFLRVAAYLDDEGAGDDFELEFDEDTWADGQPLLLESGRVLSDGTAQYVWNDLLLKGGAAVGKRAIFRLRWDAAFVLLGYSTLGAGSEIVKLRDDGDLDDEEYRVLLLARKTNGSAAAIYSYDGSAASVLETGDGAELQLADFNAPGAFDFARAGDKIWVAGSASDLFFIDLDSGEASGNMKPRGEARDLAFVESIEGKIYALFSDPELDEDKTKCWRWNGSWKAAWTLDESVTKVTVFEEGLLLAAGAKLYSTPGDAAPTLVEEFSADISAPGARFVGLENGKLLELVDGDWLERSDRSGPIVATAEVSFISGETDDPRGVAGEATPSLLEATINPAVWSDGRVLAAPALMSESVTGVTALHRFLMQISEAEGDPAQPGYVPPVYREILLIGAAPDGALLTIEQSVIARNPLAVEAAHVGSFYALPVHETIPEPVEVEEE